VESGGRRPVEGGGRWCVVGQLAVDDRLADIAGQPRRDLLTGESPLSCTFYWSADAATDVLASGYLWSFGRPLDLFFEEVVALPGWAWALDGVQAPRSLVIALDEV
jgi:hypothetical protein